MKKICQSKKRVYKKYTKFSCDKQDYIKMYSNFYFFFFTVCLVVLPEGLLPEMAPGGKGGYFPQWCSTSKLSTLQQTPYPCSHERTLVKLSASQKQSKTEDMEVEGT